MGELTKINIIKKVPSRPLPISGVESLLSGFTRPHAHRNLFIRPQNSNLGYQFSQLFSLGVRP